MPSDSDVAGVPVGKVVQPGDPGEVAGALRECTANGSTVVVRGSGTRLSWGGRPSSVDVLLDLSRLDAVLEHAAGDLVVHVQAGARLDTVQQQLAGAAQRLAIDPFAAPGSDHPGTIGGIIATAAAGPLRFAHGSVRDLLIGVELVLADGTVARAGGRVVKNVAGYDLGKLVTGAWGTLAVVTSAWFRLHPVPPVTRWVSAEVDDVRARLQALAHSQLALSAVELDRPADGPATVAVQVAGTEAGVAARVAELGGDATDRPPAWWRTAPWGPGGVGLRLTHELTGITALLGALDDATTRAGLGRATVRGSAATGVVHAGLEGDAARVAAVVAGLRTRCAAWGGDVVVLDAPPAVHDAVDVWGPVRGLEVMRRIKDQFDPEHRLAPGRFVGGI